MCESYGSGERYRGCVQRFEAGREVPFSTPPFATRRRRQAARVPFTLGGQANIHRTPEQWQQIFKQHADTIRNKSKELATTLNQLGWAGTMVGMFFEPMFHDHVITKKSITIDKTTYAIKAHQSVTIGHSKPPAELDTLYLPASRVNDTFDSYFLHCATGGGKVRLILVQVTIGATHTGVSFKGAVKKVYDAARDKWKASNVELWMVYAVPKGSAFDRKDMSMKNVKKADQPKISYKTIEAPFDFQLDPSK